MKKKLSLILSIIMIVSLLAGCGSNDTPEASPGTDVAEPTQATAPEEVYNIKFAHICSDDAANALSVVYFKDLIEERSNGRIKVDIYSNSALGNERELTEMLQAGSLEMAVLGPCSMGNVVWPQLNVLEAPYLFHSEEEVLNAMESDYADQLVQDIYDNTNIYIIGWQYRGSRHLFTLDPVHTPEDIKGMKIRVPTVDVYVETFNNLGCNVTPIAYNELYSSLQTSVVEGFEGAFDLTYASRLYEVVDNCSTIAWCNYFGPVVVAKDFYESLPEDLQQLMEECIDEMSKENTRLIQEAEATLEEAFINEGVEVYHADVSEWAALFTDEVIADMAHCWDDEGSTEVYKAWQEAAKG